MNSDQVLQVVAKVLEVDLETINLLDKLETLGWDSLSSLGFLAILDQDFGLQIDAQELARASTTAELIALVLK